MNKLIILIFILLIPCICTGTMYFYDDKDEFLYKKEISRVDELSLIDRGIVLNKPVYEMYVKCPKCKNEHKMEDRNCRTMYVNGCGIVTVLRCKSCKFKFAFHGNTVFLFED